MNREDPDAVALLAIEQIIGALDSMAESQRNMCDIVQELVKEMKRQRSRERK